MKKRRLSYDILDIDECGNNSDNCDSNAICSNKLGSFGCACKSGYSGDGLTCADVDECSDSSWNNCDATFADCTNTVGSYKCTCKQGYSGIVGKMTYPLKILKLKKIENIVLRISKISLKCQNLEYMII